MGAITIISKFNAVAKLMQAVDDPELLKNYMDLQGAAFELTEQIKEKDETIKQLEEALSLKGKFICKGSVYFIADENGEFIDGPFCTKCFDVDHNKCRIILTGRSDNPTVQCLKCKVPFNSVPSMHFLRRQHSSE
jgi:hypothetical protein